MSAAARGASLIGLCLLVACGGSAELQQRRAETETLERQVRDLRELLRDVRGGTLLGRDRLVVAVKQDVVRRLLAGSLPQEFVVAGRLRVRVEGVEVDFQSHPGSITLRGRLSATSGPPLETTIAFRGGLEPPEVAAAGALVARLRVDDLTAAEAPDRPSLLGAIGAAAASEALSRVRALIPPIEIPVRLAREVAFDGFSAGPVSVPAGRLAIDARVARVVSFSGRLWVLLALGNPSPAPPADP